MAVREFLRDSEKGYRSYGLYENNAVEDQIPKREDSPQAGCRRFAGWRLREKFFHGTLKILRSNRPNVPLSIYSIETLLWSTLAHLPWQASGTTYPYPSTTLLHSSGNCPEVPNLGSSVPMSISFLS